MDMDAPSPATTDTTNDLDTDPGDDSSTDGLPADDNNTPDHEIVLTPEMLAASPALAALKVGDTFDITITGTVTDMQDGTITADIEDAMDGKMSSGDSAAPMPPTKKPQSRVVSPKDMGAGFEEGAY